jgi:Reverse transcriptase (RNA-dependent DNA polymerase)
VTSDPGVPQTFDEAFVGPNKEFWRPAIYKELMSFISRKVFKTRNKQQIIQQLKRKLMTTKWIFKEKINPDGTIKYKARCVSRGFMQIPGVDYTESFAPVASDSGIRIVIGIFLYYLHQRPKDNWVLESFDVEVAFLNAMLSHPVHIAWPKGIKELDS